MLFENDNFITSDVGERAVAAYLGFACGDALGATVEFMTPEQIREKHGIHRDIIGGGWLKLRAGQVTDDTEMALALGQAIIKSRGWDLRAVAEGFAAWLQTKPVDVGNSCRRGIRRYLKQGTLSAPPSEYDAGNGACMRNLPVILATLGSDADYSRWTVEQCHLTHHHPLSDEATLTLGRMVRKLLGDARREECWVEAEELIVKYPVFRFAPYPGLAGGYIVETVQTVLHHFFATESFESCVVETVNCGGDADTTGALAGMLAGAYYGLEAIPKRWLDRLDADCKYRIYEQTRDLLALATKRR